MGGTIIKQPEITIALANADRTVGVGDQRVLFVGQKTSAGSATAGVLQQNISPSGAPETTLFGEDSMLAAMIRGGRKVNKQVRFDAIALDDAGGAVARVLDFSVTGTATAAGSITVVAGSEVDHKFVIPISVGDTSTAIGAAITAAVNADAKVPFTCSDSLGDVTLTAVNAGAVANDLGVEVILTDAAGITIDVALVQTTAGATDPTLTSVLDVASERYQTIVWPYSDLSVVQTFLGARQDPTNDILDGIAVHVEQDTLSNLLSYANAENDRNVVVFADKQESPTNYLGPAMNEASYVKASLFAGVRSLRLTADASISQYVTTSASLDRFGGPAGGSLPYFNTPIRQLPIIPSDRGWDQLEIEQLLAAGASVMGVNRTGTTPLLGEVVTTFKTDPAGNPDPTFTFLNYVDTSSLIREYYFNNYKARFAQSRLTLGAVTRGRDMVNPTIIRAFSEQLYLDLSGVGFVLTQDDETSIQSYKDNLEITLDLFVGKATVVMQVPIVTQLRTIIATIKVAFSAQ